VTDIVWILEEGNYSPAFLAAYSSFESLQAQWPGEWTDTGNGYWLNGSGESQLSAFPCMLDRKNQGGA